MEQKPGKKIKDLRLFTLKKSDVTGNLVKPVNDFIEFEIDDRQTIVSRFQDQVETNPHQLALKTGSKTYTYKELNETVNKIARIIINRYKDESGGSGAAMLFEQGTEMIIAILAILKTGKYYIPLDPVYPFKRLVYMLKDSNVKLLLTTDTHKTLADRLVKELDNRITLINVSSTARDESVNRENLGIKINPNDLLYILYTSGSTGTPKGVIQTHRNMLYFIRIYTNNLHIHPGDRLSLFSSYCFDASGMDIYGALLNGAALFPYDLKQPGNLECLPGWLQEERITIYHSVPTLFRYFTAMLRGDEELEELRVLVMGGEPVYKQDVENYKKYFNDRCLFLNLFGSTEASIALLYFFNKSVAITKETVPIGFPIDEMDVILRSENNEDEKKRVYGTGEIIFKSPHVTPGYLNQQEKASDVFRKDRYSGQCRLYLTGDMGRLLPDGMFEYLGRKDLQVKIRGCRVELGEIESVLNRVDGIEKSAALCQTDQKGETYLAVYYVKEKHKKIEIKEIDLKKWVKGMLPDYMVPARLICLERFPLTSTGKILRRALPRLDDSELLAGTELTAPRNQLEEKMREIWTEILGLETHLIGMESSFFDLGGHSLKVTLLVSRIHKELGVKIPLAVFFDTPFIRELSEYIKKNAEVRYDSIEPAPHKNYYVLSPAQKRLFFYQQLHVKGTAYNMPEFHILDSGFEIEKMDSAFQKLIQRHENLRTSFKIIDGEPVQQIHKKVKFEVEYYFTTEGVAPPTYYCCRNTQMPKKKSWNENKVLHDRKPEHTIKNFVRSFDLSQAPLLRVGLLRLEKSKHLLMIDMHHNISDGISHSILIQDFWALYEGKELPTMRLQYKDYSEWMNRQMSGDALKKQEAYWLKVFQEDIPVLDLPTDYQRPQIQSFEGGKVSFEIDPEETAALKTLARMHDATLFMVLLSAYFVLLSKLSGQQDIVVGTVAAGRNHADLEHIIGVFVNPLALRSYPSDAKPFNSFLEEVKTRTIETFDNQDFQFDSLVEKVVRKRDFSRQPIYSSGFSLEKFDQLHHQTPEPPVLPFSFEKKISRIDLNLLGTETPVRLLFAFEYCSRLFKRETIERFTRYFKIILSTIIANPGKKIKEIDIIPGEETNILRQNIQNTRKSMIADFDI